MIRTTFVLILALASTSAFAFDVGDTVVAIHHTTVEAGSQTGDKVVPGTVLVVEAIDGDRLWVPETHPGWLDSRHVVTVDQAAPLLTEMIRKQPEQVSLYLGRAST